MDHRKKHSISYANKKLINEFIEFYISHPRRPNTVKSMKNTLYKLATFVDPKYLKKLDKELQEFFKSVSIGSYNLYGTQIKMFYRWCYTIDSRDSPPSMRFFRNASKLSKRKNQDPNPKRYLITPELYQRILDQCKDKYGMWEGLFECYYLTGGRLNEVLSMNVDHVLIEHDGVTLYLPQSKTKPRENALSEIPNLLIRWLNNHPRNNNPKVSAREFIEVSKGKNIPLWVGVGNRNFSNRLSTSGVDGEITRIRKKLGHYFSCKYFRITRATILFNLRSKDGGLIYDDTRISLFMGWTPEQVASRRREYDLTGYDDLKKFQYAQVQNTIKDYDVLEYENKELVKKQQIEIDELKEQVSGLVDSYSRYSTATRNNVSGNVYTDIWRTIFKEIIDKDNELSDDEYNKELSNVLKKIENSIQSN